MKHTPGKWLGQNTSSGQGLIYSEIDGKTIALAYDTRDTNIIAAVPELLDALQRIAGHQYRADRRHRNMVDVKEVEDLKRIARLAIDKTKEG